MDQAKLSRPAPRWPASVLADAKYESWLSEARDFARPWRPGLSSKRWIPYGTGPLLFPRFSSFNSPSRHTDIEHPAVLRACERFITPTPGISSF